MTMDEMYAQGYLLGQQLVQITQYTFVGFGILSALLIVLIFTIVWSKNVQ